MTRVLLAALIGILAAGQCWASEICGGAESPCTVPSGAYFTASPPWHEGDPLRPAVIFLHGAGGSGEEAAANPDLASPIAARGYVLLAPTGLARDGRDGHYWSLGNRPPVRDEAGFLKEILDDAAPRFHLDRDRVFVTGFSMGAGLVWQLACQDPGGYAAYGPIAGGFWHERPASCGGPVKMLLTQGWRDDAVPIEGWDDGAGVEGGVFDQVQIWRTADRCPNAHAASYDAAAQFWQRTWTDCAPGSALTFAMHPGGHEVPEGWADMALDWFEAVVPTSH